MNFMNSGKLTVLATALFAGSILSASAKPLSIWISSYQDKVYYESMVNAYKESVDAEFEAEVQAFGFQEMPDKLAVSIKSGANPPDIVQLDEVLFGTYLNGEVPFVELSEQIKSSGLDKDVLPQRLSLFAYQGKTYGVPQSLSAMVLYYRTDLFEKFDLTPEKLATWEDFAIEGYRLADQRQAMIALDPTYFEILLRQQGSDLFGLDGKPFPDRQKAIETLNYIKDLHQNHIATLPERSSIFDPVFFNSLNYGEVLCVIGADWYGLDMLQQFTPELSGKWGVMPLPAWKDKNGVPGRRTSTFAGQGLLIYKESPNPDSAWKFIEYVMKNRDANVKRFVDGNSFPAYTPVWSDPEMQKPMKFFNNQPFGRILAELAPELPSVAMHPKRPQAVFVFQENFFNSFIYGQLTAGEVLDQMTGMLSGN